MKHLEGYAPLLDGLRAERGDPRQFLSRAGVDPDAEITESPVSPPEVALRLLDDAIEQFGPGFPLRCAERVRIETFGVLGYTCLTAPDVRTALERAVRYRRLVFDREDFHLDPAPNEGLWLVRRTPEPSAHPRADAALVELGLAEHLVAIRELLDEPVSPDTVHFAHAAPAQLSEHERFFQAPLLFGAIRSAIRFNRELLARAPKHAHPGLAQYFAAQAAQLLANKPSPQESTVRRVRELVSKSLHGGVPRAEDVARALAVSERTLTRRLTEEGTTLKDVVDQVRHELALGHLERGTSLGEIAYLLGFSEPSAFHRAFKRWTGKTPGQLRPAQR